MLGNLYLVLCLISYRTVRKAHDRVKVEHHGTENKLIKNMTVHIVEWRFTQFG